MGVVQDKKIVFSTRSCKEESSGPLRVNQGISKAEPRDGHAAFGYTYPPCPILPFLLKQNLSPKVIAGSDVTR